MSRRLRLDLVLVERGLAPSRERAQRLIMAGLVEVEGRRCDKAGQGVDPAAAIVVKGPDHPYVSRGGVKLAHALKSFPIEVAGKRCLDLGASTGGFTDCLLQAGAREVIAVDVGKGQLDHRLRNDPRVVVREEINARRLTAEEIGGPAELVVADLSFISLTLVLPALRGLLREGGDALLLVKPQFEVGKGKVGKGGVVRDPELRRAALEKVKAAAIKEGFLVGREVESPIKGAKGNVEYLLWLGAPAAVQSNG